MSYSNNDTSEDLHPKPSLVDLNTIDKAMNESSNNITSSTYRNFTTDNNTDMLWEQLANEAKMVKTSEQQYFAKDGNDDTSDISSTHSTSSSYSRRSKTSAISDHKTSDAINNRKSTHGINLASLPTNQHQQPTQSYQQPSHVHQTHEPSQQQPHIHSFPPQPSQAGPSHGNGQTFHQNEEKSYEFTKEQIQLQKLDMIRKLGELHHNGVTLSQKYTIESDLDAMKFEYELHTSIRAKQNSVNWMSSVLMNCIYGIEMLNDKYDPFSINLSGWSQQMSRDSNSYYDVFGELYEKYNKPGKSVPPEIKLLFMITGSATKFALQNAAVNAIPNLAEKFKSNPELAANLRAKAQADKMKQMDDQQQQNLQKYINKQHTDAMEKMNNLKMLEEKKKEFIIKQNDLRRQEELNKLQEQLGSNTPSLYSYQQNSNSGLIKPVSFPQEMMQSKTQDNVPYKPPYTTQIPQMSQQIPQQTPLQQIPQMSQQMSQQVPQQVPQQIPQIPLQQASSNITNHNAELYRQQSIMNQKKIMQQQEIAKMNGNQYNMADNISSGETHVQLKPKLQELMKKDKFDDTESRISSVSVSDIDNISNNSRVILKRKRKKTNSLKIDT